MKVLILHTLPPTTTDADRRTSEYDLNAAARNVAEALPKAEVEGVQGDLHEVVSLLDRVRPDVIFNLCEAPLGRPGFEAHVAALFEWLGVRFTGSGSETLALCRRKDRVNAVLSAATIPVPRSDVFPCIVKPADEDGSAGIHTDSICRDQEALERTKARLAGPAIVQEFLTGREFVVLMWGQRSPEHSAVGEVCFRNGLQLVTYAAKWDRESPEYANSPLEYNPSIDAEPRARLVEIASRVWGAVEARGYLRVDMRLGGDSQPYVLDVNPNPDLSPDGGVSRAVHEAGWNWCDFVRQQVEWA